MVDIGAEQTDRLLEDLEKRLEKEYAQAYKEVEKKAADYFVRFEKKDKAKQAEVAAGKLTEKEYQQWRKNQMLTGKRWTDLRDQLAADLTRKNQIAAAMVRGELNEVFAINANYSEYMIENGMRTNYGFTLYDRNTVANLVKNDPDIIPWKPEVDIPADLRWNRQMITSHITQGILQGESIPNLSKRLMKTVNNDKVAAVRTARTAVTSSQNAGRQMVYDKAQKMGLKLKKQWLATLDGRTRHDHGVADGQTVDLDGFFEVGGEKMKYPGDMSASGHLVYNCRCTVITVEPPHITKGEEPRKTYDEWIEEKGGKEYEQYQKASAKVATPKKPEFVPAKTIEEATQRAREMGVAYPQFDKWNVEMANNALEAVSTLPTDCRPKLIANGKDVSTATGRPLGRKADQWWGVTYDYRPFSLRTMQLGYDKNDYDGGLIVGINTTKFKTLDAITRAKEATNARYFEKTGHFWNFNTDGRATSIHEMGHCFVDVRGLPNGWETASQKWATESKCDLLLKPDEAFAEAWAAYHLGDTRLPKYISDIIGGLK